MSDIKQIWQQALEELGDMAFERFLIKFKNQLLHVHDNKTAEMSLDILELKPLYELFAHDVEVYGENAYLMWSVEDFHYDDMTLCDADDNDDVINNAPNIVRKKSAALPFDLERAKKGGVVEWFNGEIWSLCIDVKECHGTEIAKITSESGINHHISFNNLRMKYPPKVAM